jgi:hypothetical protein
VTEIRTKLIPAAKLSEETGPPQTVAARPTGVAGERNAGIAAPLGRSGKVVEPSFDLWAYENLIHFASNRRKYIFAKPWILVFPDAASPRRMR